MTNKSTAQKMIEMASNGERQKAAFWLRNIKARHSKEHYRKLVDEIRRLKESRDES